MIGWILASVTTVITMMALYRVAVPEGPRYEEFLQAEYEYLKEKQNASNTAPSA